MSAPEDNSSVQFIAKISSHCCLSGYAAVTATAAACTDNSAAVAPTRKVAGSQAYSASYAALAT
jgi:hypothetical protein